MKLVAIFTARFMNWKCILQEVIQKNSVCVKSLEAKAKCLFFSTCIFYTVSTKYLKSYLQTKQHVP